MPVTLNDTVGDPEANTYADLAYFKDYLSSRPKLTWTDEAITGSTLDDELSSNLIMAARIEDSSFVWTGQASTSSQALSWPRTGMYNRNGYLIPSNANPKDLKDSQCELAVQLKQSPDLFDESKASRLGIKKVDATDASVEFHAANTNSVKNLEYLSLLSSGDLRYLKIPSIVRAMLPPSWYVESSPTTFDDTADMIFEVL